MAKKFKVSGYDLTSDPSFQDEAFGMTQELKNQVVKLFEEVNDSKNTRIIEKLTDLIIKHPKSPLLKNFLSTAYTKRGNFEKAYEANNWILKEHPDYLFAKLNLAHEYMQTNRLELVPEIMGEAMELKALYPQRDLFHIGEFAAYYKAAIRYFCETDQFELAENRLDVVNEILEPSERKDLFKMIVEIKERREKTQGKIIPFVPISDANNMLPFYNHPEIMNLYKFGIEIPKEFLQQIIDLPKKTVIADLEKILKDAVELCDMDPDDVLDYDDNTIVLHAICLLAEINNKKSLAKILTFLKNDEDIVDYWLEEYLVHIWHPIFKLGLNQLELLKQFLLTQDISTYAKASVSEALVQIVLQIPEKRNEILNIYREVLECCSEHLIADDITEDEFLTYIVEDTAKCGLIELKSIVEGLYEKELIDESEVPLSLYLDFFVDNDFSFAQEAPLAIFELYDYINKEMENDYDDDDFDDDEFDVDDLNEYDDFDDDNKIIKPFLSHSTLEIELPVFNHKIVEELFEYNMIISRDTLRTILELPREEIIPDLIKVIDFAIENSQKYFEYNSRDWDNTKTNFPLHSMFLLAEMREEKAFDIIVKFLSQKEEYLDFWLGDFLTEEIWKILLLTGQNRLPDLVKMVTNYELNQYVRNAASQALAQTALHYPEKRSEIIMFYKEILEIFLKDENAEDELSPEILGAVVCDIIDIKATDLLNLIKDCQDKDIIDKFWVHTFEDVEKEIYCNDDHKNAIDDIFTTYDSIVTSWASYTGEEDRYNDDDFSDDEDDENNKIIPSGEPFIRENPKVGRNDPCPCGSGKKYKKCCIDK